MQNFVIEKDVVERYNIPRQTLRDWRNGVKQIKNGKPYSFDPKLTEGRHWYIVGRSVVYTDAGLEEVERLDKKRLARKQ